MAKLTGIVKLTGTLGEVNFYTLKGETVSRRAGGGFNGKVIKTSPKMARVRENGSEFKSCMQSVKYFKHGLNPFLTMVRDGELHQRIVSLFTKIKDTDVVSVRGQRHVGAGLETAEGQQLLKGYILNSGVGLMRILRQPFTFLWDTGFVVAGFAAETVAFPNTATHLELTALFYVFDFDANESKLEKSETLLIARDSVGMGSLVLSPVSLPEGSGRRIGLVFYRFLQEINGELYDLKEGNTRGMEVVGIN